MRATCSHCERPMRPSRAAPMPGVVPYCGKGLCTTCRGHQRKHGDLEGWYPAGHPGRQRDAALIEARLDTYAGLRRLGLTRRECAERMELNHKCLEKFLLRCKDDPRSDSVDKATIMARWKAQRTWQGVRTLGVDPETIRKAALTVVEHCPDDARTLLAMLGLVAA